MLEFELSNHIATSTCRITEILRDCASEWMLTNIATLKCGELVSSSYCSGDPDCRFVQVHSLKVSPRPPSIDHILKILPALILPWLLFDPNLSTYEFNLI